MSVLWHSHKDLHESGRECCEEDRHGGVLTSKQRGSNLAAYAKTDAAAISADMTESAHVASGRAPDSESSSSADT